MKLNDHFQRFLEERRYLKGVSAKTLRCYRGAWNAFEPFLADVKSEKQLRGKLKDAVMSMRQRKPSKSMKVLRVVSINNYIRHMNAFTAWMLAEKIITEPARLDKMKEPTIIRKILSDDDIRAFMRFKPRHGNEKRVQMMGLVVLDCGLRLEEVRKLKRKDIDFDNFLIKVFRGKGDKQRIVPFGIELRKSLFKWVVNLQATDFLFGTKSGRLVSQRNALRDLHTVGEKLKIMDIGFHKMRHTFATNYYKRSRDLVALQRILGHATITTTMIYMHMQTEDLTEHNQERSLLNALRTA